jgi:hypothetical protein
LLRGEVDPFAAREDIPIKKRRQSRHQNVIQKEEQPMYRQTIPQDQLEDLKRRELVLEEKARHFKKVASAEGSTFEDAERALQNRDELVENRKTQASIELAMESRGVVARSR